MSDFDGCGAVLYIYLNSWSAWDRGMPPPLSATLTQMSSRPRTTVTSMGGMFNESCPWCSITARMEFLKILLKRFKCSLTISFVYGFLYRTDVLTQRACGINVTVRIRFEWGHLVPDHCAGLALTPDLPDSIDHRGNGHSRMRPARLIQDRTSDQCSRRGGLVEVSPRIGLLYLTIKNEFVKIFPIFTYCADWLAFGYLYGTYRIGQENIVSTAPWMDRFPWILLVR